MCRTFVDLPAEITPYHSARVVDQDPGGYVQQDALEEMRSSHRSCGVNEENHADPTVPPLPLTCYSFQMELGFTGADDFSDIPSGRPLNTYATTDAHRQRSDVHTKLLHPVSTLLSLAILGPLGERKNKEGLYAAEDICEGDE